MSRYDIFEGYGDFDYDFRDPVVHVLRFEQHNGIWSAVVKEGRVTRTFLISDRSQRQPTSDQEVWLCHEREIKDTSQFSSHVRVTLQQLLFNSEVKLNFLFTGPDRQGKFHWNAEPSSCGSGLYLTCSPDRHAKTQPTNEHPFWVCRFNRLASLKRTRHGAISIIAIMELVREDTEAKERHDAEMKAQEAIREANRLEEKKRRNEEAQILQRQNELVAAEEAHRAKIAKLEAENPWMNEIGDNSPGARMRRNLAEGGSHRPRRF